MEIVPAVLTDSRDEFVRFFKDAEGFCRHIQIDIMDGRFVPSQSIGRKDIEGMKGRRYTEAHLMVEDPLEWLDVFERFGAQRVVFHFEIKSDKDKVISLIRERGFEVGLGINPSTRIEEFSSLVDKVDVILFLSVNPGFYGAEFISEVLDKIKEFKKKYPRKPIGIDGGIKLDNVKDISALGIDFICVGSAIFKAADSARSYREFVHAVST